MALADLAGHTDDGAIALSVVAERQSLPLAYLEQLFVPLRRAGLVESARGRSGGYRLAKPAAQVSVAAIMAAVEEDTRFTRCSHNDPRCSAATPCVTHGLWNALSETTGEFLSSVSLADVIMGGRYSARSGLTSFPPRGAGKRTYLDYNATAPLRPEAKAAMVAATRCHRQRVVGSWRRTARPFHRRKCAGERGAAGRSEGIRDRFYERRD